MTVKKDLTRHLRHPVELDLGHPGAIRGHPKGVPEMKATLTFTIPEELNEYRAHIDGPKAIDTLQDVQEELRRILKYGTEIDTILNELAVIHKSIYEAFPDIDER